MEQKNKKDCPLGNLSSMQTFVGGIIVGILVLCTIGFFVLLNIYLTSDTVKTVVDEMASSEDFNTCLDEGKYTNTVKADMQLGASIGVNGTPATFVNGYLLSGALPFEMFKQVIDTLLAGEEPNFDFMKDRETGEITKIDMPDLPNVEWKGDKNAKITVVEFSDFECPYCANFTPTITQMLAEYGNQVRFTYRHFPLSFHQNAQKAAEAFECAKEQGQWYEMHDKLFELSEVSGLNIANYKKAATELGLK
jgi:protein-disulfide isomerase